MQGRNWVGSVALTVALLLATAPSHAFDDAQYPDLSGQWTRIGPDGVPLFDPTKSAGQGEDAPLTPEYRVKYEASLADMAAGGEGDWGGFACRPPGMPALMTAYEDMEFVIKPATTYILVDHIHETHRRIFTDGRAWPKEIEPTFVGYSIGRWIDDNGGGRFDALEVETRAMKGPRTFDATGLPLHEDNETVIKERIFLDKADANVLHDEITVTDHALTRPWTVLKSYRRIAEAQPSWHEYICAENNAEVRIGNQLYFYSADGRLMPSRKNQPAPDLRYFKTASPANR